MASHTPPSHEVAREEMLRLESACIAAGGCPVCQAIRAARLALEAPLSPEECAYLSGALRALSGSLYERAIEGRRA